MLEIDDFVENSEESDERYICYNPRSCVRIFNYTMDDTEEIRINISKNIFLKYALDVLNKYVKWICQCENTLKPYYEKELGQKVYDNWFDDIEIYSADITFNSIEDYGATIYCGDPIIQDHILEIEFDKMHIEAIRLNG